MGRCEVTNGNDQIVFRGRVGECLSYANEHRDTLGYWLLHKRTAEGRVLIKSALTAGHLKVAS